jgi:signal transduction histidine kinase
MPCEFFMTTLPASVEEHLAPVRERLVYRLFQVLLPMAAILIGLRAGRGLQVLIPGIVLLLYMAAHPWALRARRNAKTAYIYGLIAILGAFELYWGLRWPDQRLPPVLALLASNGLLFHLCWSARAGWLAFGLSLLDMAVIFALKGPFDVRAATFFVNLALSMLALQAVAVLFERSFNALWRNQDQQRQGVERLRQARARLVSALLDNLEIPLKWTPPGGDGQQELARQLRAGLEEAKRLRQSMGPPEPLDLDLGTRRQSVGPLLWVGLAVSATLAVRDLLDRHPDGLIGAGLSLTLLAGILWLRARPGDWKAVSAGALLAAVAAFSAAALTSSADRIPGVLAFGTLLIAYTALWHGLRPAVLLSAYLIALDLWCVFGRGSGLATNEQAIAINLVQQWLAVSIIIAPAARARQELLERVDSERRALVAGLRVQRRLLGTLYHDAANHVMALVNMAAVGDLDKALPAEQERFLRIHGRLYRLVDSARNWLLSDGAIDPELTQPLPVKALGAAMQDLFHERLAEKGLRLDAELPEDLALRGVPELVHDGVLGNLLSNAIKFSPRGARVQVAAWSERDQVCVAVLDEGPGLPPGVLSALRNHESLPSRPGSEGESGQGLGLGLAAEHLRRMGGRLELLNRPEGGTEARLWLPKA